MFDRPGAGVITVPTRKSVTVAVSPTRSTLAPARVSLIRSVAVSPASELPDRGPGNHDHQP